MNLTSWIDSNIKIMDFKLMQSIRKKQEEMNERGLLHSGIAADEYLSVTFEAINNEIIRITTDFGKLKLIKKKQIEDARQKINILIKEKADYISKYISSNTGTVIGSPLLQTKIVESTSILSIYTEIIEQERKSRVFKICWDISKMVVSAIIGGLLSIYLKEHFGTK